MAESTPRSDDLAACVALMRTGSRSFFAASRLLPPRVRDAAIALYAFCRVADDIVDERGLAPDVSRRVLSDRLDGIYAGQPTDAVEDRALSLVVAQHRLPRPLLDALLDGFAWDASGRRYDTIEELHDYGARVAGSVGAMMCWLMGVRSPVALARACEMGVAMQLTNIARDVGEDARLGRLYLPRAWMREVGLDPDAWLRSPECCFALQGVVGRLLDEADRLYRQASHGVALLPRDCRAAILAARFIYAEIGSQLRRNGLDPVNRRAVVSTRRKMALAAAASLQAHWVGRGETSEPLAAITYLVDHCRGEAANDTPDGTSPRSIGERVVWMVELFDRVHTQRFEQRVAQMRSGELPAPLNG